MTQRHTSTALDQAAALLLDALRGGDDVSVEISLAGVAEAAVAQLLAALNEEARRRGWGVAAEPIEGDEPCLSLRRR